ncbi:DUF21 domain-containing protein At5g52790 [Hondaea fermentalgiana]|uniref:DUF21 domain-containing protein At5g52790 n=1 Tax=Hondaea fermentalgiana TaxID=2315210 RepID=A0A2R5GF23_9STRA|nr:DUF21 domain-containing protein At5g52790 [Hondaea fermentalgiana]|eukprot:GBG29520.1 DUF21 domain-containing protein At5g52790 [Hondaea fermentalgiana]
MRDAWARAALWAAVAAACASTAAAGGGGGDAKGASSTVAAAAAAKAADDGDCGNEDSWLPPDDPDFLPYVVASVFLVLMGGTMSGLQAGMMQLDRPALQTLRETGSPVLLRLLDMLEPLIRKRHMLLVTLLISNAVAMEALPIFLDVLVPKAVAIVLSVSMVLLFGEIVPQAMCLRWPGELSCMCTPLVWALLVLFFPIVYPIARLLDYLLGEEHHATYSRAGLGELARQQGKLTGHGVLEDDELDIITGTLELHDKKADQLCVPLDHAFKLSYTDKLTDKVLRDILDHGHSRIPIWKDSPSNIIGLLLVKHLIRIDPETEIQVSDLQIMPILVVDQHVSLFALLRRFRTGTSHMAAIKRNPGPAPASPLAPDTSARASHVKDVSEIGLITRPRSTTESEDLIQVSTLHQTPIETIGILTLEDVIEELLKHDIEDETDRWVPVNEELDQRISKVRSLRDHLLSSLEQGTQQVSQRHNASAFNTTGHTTGTQGERDSLLRGSSRNSESEDFDEATSGGNRPSSISYGSLNEFNASISAVSSRGSSAEPYDSPRSTNDGGGGTVLRMLQQ